MNLKAKLGLVIKYALEIDGLIDYNYNYDTTSKEKDLISLVRKVEGEPGEDPFVDEDMAKIVQAPMVVGYVRGKLEECGIGEDEWFVDIIENPGRGVSTQFRGYPIRIWIINWFFNRKIIMGPGEIIGKCANLEAGHQWREGIRVSKKSKSSKFKVGQQVRPSRALPETKFKWWFITSYRSGGMGHYRLLRSDGRLSSTSDLTPIYEDENEEETKDPDYIYDPENTEPPLDLSGV